MGDYSVRLLNNFTTKTVKINIIHIKAIEKQLGFFISEEMAKSFPHITILQFIISELAPNCDRMLYLDSDLVVKSDILELFNVNLKGNYAAAIINAETIFLKGEKINETFNQGVVLYNIPAILNSDEIKVRLLEIENSKNFDSASLNFFNYIFDNKILQLPIKYNFMPVCLDLYNSKWKIKDINFLYHTTYRNKKELYSDAAIIHYTTDVKPWNFLDSALASEWISEYLKADIPHDLVKLEQQNEPYAISVIMPCFNSEKYVKSTLDAILKQQFDNYEVICLDDKSTDNTLTILREYEKNYDNVRVVASEHFGQGHQRNIGIQMAKGKYIYFADSDDLIRADSLKKIYNYAEENNLDLLYFEGNAFYDDPLLEQVYPQYKTAYHRREAYPKVYSGRELYILFRNAGEFIVSPGIQLIKRSLLIENKLKFPQISIYEDEIFSRKVLLKAKRVKCIDLQLLFRRVRKKSVMTAKSWENRVTSLSVVIQELLKDFENYKEDIPLLKAFSIHLRLYMKRMASIYSELSAQSATSIWNLLLPEQWELLLLALYIENENTQAQKRIEKISQAYTQQLQNSNEELKDLYNEVKKLKGNINMLTNKCLALETEREGLNLKVKNLKVEVENAKRNIDLQRKEINHLSIDKSVLLQEIEILNCKMGLSNKRCK